MFLWATKPHFQLLRFEFLITGICSFSRNRELLCYLSIQVKKWRLLHDVYYDMSLSLKCLAQPLLWLKI